MLSSPGPERARPFRRNTPRERSRRRAAEHQQRRDRDADVRPWRGRCAEQPEASTRKGMSASESPPTRARFYPLLVNWQLPFMNANTPPWRVWTPWNNRRCRLALSAVRFGPCCGRPKRSEGSPEDGRKRCGITAISAAGTRVRGGKRRGWREISDSLRADRNKPWSRPRQTRIAVFRAGLIPSTGVSFSEKVFVCSGPGSASSWVAA